MRKTLETYTTDELQQLMENAKRAGNQDAYNQALNLYCRRMGEGDTDPVVCELWACLFAVEAKLTEDHNGRRTPSQRFRNSAKVGGIVAAADRVLQKTKGTVP